MQERGYFDIRTGSVKHREHFVAMSKVGMKVFLEVLPLKADKEQDADVDH